MFIDWRGYLAGTILTLVVTLLVYLVMITFISIHAEIIYVLPIVVIAIYYGLGPAIFTAILSDLTFDYFFIPPLFTLGPRNTQDIPILVTFLLVGIIVGFLGVRLRESEGRFRSIVETAGEGIVMVNPENIITYVNKKFPEMLGYSMEEIKGKSILDFTDTDYTRELRQRLEKRKKGIRESYELAYRRKDGSIQWVRINGSPLFDSNGKHIGSVGMHTDITDEKNLRDQLEDYAKKLIQIQEEERKRIARELHDDTAPTLSYLSLEVDAVISKFPDLPDETVNHLRELREKINEAQENIRRFSHELHPSILDNLGLEAALEALVMELNARGTLEVDFRVSGAEESLPDEVELNLYRIAQEALNNIWKHSQATEAEVNLEYSTDKTVLTISDNGVGFDSSKLPKGGLGLTGMRERALLIGGILKVESEPGKGTRVVVETKATDQISRS